MPSVAERRRNNVKAGIFVTLTLLLAVAVIGVLTGLQHALTQSYTPYTVTFDVADGVKNIKQGAAVRVGGVALGEVTDVHPVVRDDGRFDDVIAVDFRLDDRVPLYSNAIILARAALIGTDAWLSIVSLGGEEESGSDAAEQTPDDAASTQPVHLLTAGDTLKGQSGPPLLETVFGPQSTAFRDDMLDFAEFLAGLDERYNEDLTPILTNLQETTRDARSVVSAVEDEHLPNWSERITEVLEWANKASTTLDTIFDESKRLVVDTRDIVNESREPWLKTLNNARATSEDVRAVADQFRNETLPKFERLIDTGQSGLDDAQQIVERFGEQFDQSAVDINETLGNARLASQQIRLATAEIRRSPWKLLYRPGPAELEHELLYEAARAFAVATADLKAAALSTKTILNQHGDLVAQDQQLAERLRNNLLDPLRNYERAQRRLYEILLLDDAPGETNAAPSAPPGRADEED